LRLIANTELALDERKRQNVFRPQGFNCQYRRKPDICAFTQAPGSGIEQTFRMPPEAADSRPTGCSKSGTSGEASEKAAKDKKINVETPVNYCQEIFK
jgi:hypothetical protein